MREQLADFGGALAAAREEIVAPEQIVYRPVASHILQWPWHRSCVVLLGDAAHTISPQMGVGAGMAIEDAIVLAEVLRTERSLDSALEQFMRRRFERCRMVVENSLQLGNWEMNPGAADADHVGLLARSLKALAEPI